MTDDIRPALNAEQWQHLEFSAGAPPWFFGFIPKEATEDGRLCGQVVGVLRLSFGAGRFENVPAEGLAPLIALANHALPDSHPNKFTREDVRVLREEGDDLVGYASDAETPEEWERQKHNGSVLLRLAARIEALLPPE